VITRRTFLTLAAAAIADNAQSQGPFLSLNSSLTGGKTSWPEFVRLAAKIGYGGADLDLTAAMKQGIAQTKALFAETKIRPSVGNLPVVYTAEEATFQAGLKRLPEAASFLAAVNCPRLMAVLPPSSTIPKTEYRKILRERLMAVSEVLGRFQIRLGLEFLGPLHFRVRLPHEFIWRMDEALAFACECGPNIGLQLDAWHWHHAGATVADILAAGNSRIVSVHVADARPLPPGEIRDNQRLLPGEGVINLMGFFQALKKIDYVGAISPEPIGRIPATMSAEEGARLGFESTVATMRKAGII
jgi:sugar phosphate isomerase/epimerase